MACSVRMMGPGIRSSRAPVRIRRLRFAIRFLGCMGRGISGRIRGFGRRRMGIALLGIGGFFFSFRFWRLISSEMQAARIVLEALILATVLRPPPPPSPHITRTTTSLTANPIHRLPKNGAPPPSFQRCQEQITSVINQYCAGPVFNAGGVNLKVFPSAGASNTSATGLPVDPLYPSYVMLPFQSHCGINAVDVC